MEKIKKKRKKVQERSRKNEKRITRKAKKLKNPPKNIQKSKKNVRGKVFIKEREKIFQEFCKENFVFVFQYKCQVEGCGFRTRRTRLISHYMKQHNMEQKEAQKLMPRRLITTAKMDHVQCPKCDHKCTPLTLRRHIFHR